MLRPPCRLHWDGPEWQKTTIMAPAPPCANFFGRGSRVTGNSPGNSHETHFPGKPPGNCPGHPREIHFAGNEFPGNFPGKYPACLIGCLPRGRHISNRGGFPAKRICRAISRTTRYQKSYRGMVRRRRPYPPNSPANRQDSPIPAALYSIFWKFFAHLAAAGLMRGRG